METIQTYTPDTEELLDGYTTMFLVVFSEKDHPIIQAIEYDLAMFNSDEESSMLVALRGKCLTAKRGGKAYYEQAYQIHTSDEWIIRTLCKDLGIPYTRGEICYQVVIS